MSRPTESEIVQGAQAAGLVPYLLELQSGYSLSNDPEFIQTVAALVASGKVDLRTDGDHDRMAAMEDWAFFSGQAILLRLIPELDVDHRQMMELVSALVRRGGDDRAATVPNAEFIRWCAKDGRRVDRVLEDARDGDPLAVDYLVFALEGGRRADEAIALLGSECGQTAASAAAALGRMNADVDTSARSLAALSEISTRTDDEIVLHHAVRSCYAVLSRHANLDRSHACTALTAAAERDSAETRHAIAQLLAEHGDELTGQETTIALQALETTAPEHLGTINLIDLASTKLSTDEARFSGLTSLVSRLIKESRGEVTLDEFALYRDTIMGDDRQRIRSLTVAWLLDGDAQLCATLTSMLTKIQREPFTLELGPEHVPASPAAQVIVCRRAVGYLFIAPVTAASILVSLLRYGGEEVGDEAARLLYDPLLLNFAGELRTYLQDVADRHMGTFGTRIKAALERAESVADLDGLPPLTELHPSEECRHIERLNQNKEVRRIAREGARQSIMRQVMEGHTLLYGNASTVYVEDPDPTQGRLRRIDVPMMSHSVSMELPRLSVFDPEGLEQLLWFLKSGKRSAD